MFLKDIVFVLYWWILLSGLGALAYPIAHYLFKNFFDKGWAFSKVIAIGLISYFVWIMGSLHLFPFRSFTIWIGIFLLTYSAYLILSKTKDGMSKFFREHWRLIVFEEAIFGVLLIFWSWVRAHQPDVNGLEKFMDFGFINSILRSEYFPPKDMWLTPESINYYYFGHLSAAVLTKLSGLASSITYNLMIATILALSFIATFSLAATLLSHLISSSRKRIPSFFPFLAGFISAAVVSFAGNLHTIYKVLIEGTSNYWYPDATRYIPYTIHEFPLYSYVVSDLHGHVSNIPFVLLMIALIFATVLSYKKTKLSLTSPSVIRRLGAMGLLVGMLYITNALDAPIYLLLAFIAFIVLVSSKNNLKKIFLNAVFATAGVAFLGFVFSLPFQLSFIPFTKGVDFVHVRSSLQKLLVLWGFFLFVSVTFLITVFLQKPRRFFSKPLFSTLCKRFFLVIIGLSALLVIIPEIIYIKDIYIEDYHRANTMFKLVYQTFVMMSLLSGPIFVALLWHIKSAKPNNIRVLLFLLLCVFAFGLGSILYYPYFAVRSYYNGLKNYRGLDGLSSWMSKRYADDYEAVMWIEEKIEGQPVILEAVGESYTDFARISANTGLPTVLGWRVHEWLWRGSFDVPGKRTTEVSTMYTSSNVQEVCSLLKKHSVEYIFLGAMERKQYPSLNETTLSAVGDLVFSRGDTRIYSLKESCLVSL